jgi:phosphoribosylglycinamide formyltransferase 1
MNFIVLSTSRGTTFQSVIDAIESGELTAECLGLVTDREDRGCIEKARAANMMNLTVDTDVDPREEFDKALHETIMDMGADDKTIICDIGWMWIHTPWFINKWKNRIINVHPALLPKHGGKGMYGHHVHDAVLEAGEEESGVTFHIMDEGVDTGPVLLQKKCAVLPGDTSESLQDRVQQLEKEYYPKLLQMIQEKKINMNS